VNSSSVEVKQSLFGVVDVHATFEAHKTEGGNGFSGNFNSAFKVF
jgi:hypothetical protein